MPSLRAFLSLVLSASAACSAGSIGTGPGDTPTADDVAPLLAVTSPERGTMTGDATIEVRGTATDDGSGIASVTVNGTAATVDSAGNFTATLPLGPGLGILETIVTDRAGNGARDVRAVLIGTLQPATGLVGDALAGKIGPSGFVVLSGLLSRMVNEIDLTAVATAQNPMVDSGGSCLGVKVNAQSVSKSSAVIQLAPVQGSLGTHAEIRNADVQLRAEFKVACIGGSAGIRIRASNVRIDGNLGLGLDGTTLRASAGGVSVAMDGFDLDVGSIPGVIVDLFEGIIDDKVSAALAGAIESNVPGMTETLLAELTGGQLSFGVLGQQVGVAFAPRTLTIDGTGMFLAADVGMTVAAGGGVDYLASPAPLTGALMAGSQSLGIAIADDLLNQLLAGMWGARAFEPAIELGPDHPAALFFGPDADRIEVSFSLPPTLAADGNGEMKLLLGDIIVTVLDTDGGGGTLVEMALSASVGLSAAVGADGRMAVTVGSPQLWAQVLSKSENLPVLFGDAQAAALAELMFLQVGDLANQAFSTLPIPLIGDSIVQSAVLESSAGYLLMQAELGM